MRSQITNTGFATFPPNDPPGYRANVGIDIPPYDLVLAEEVLVIDERAHQRPAQAGEDKLSRMLQLSYIGVGQMRLKNLLSAASK